MLNAFLPTGVTFLAVDSIFMMPHLGVLSRIRPDIALNVLEKDCFIPLGPAIAAEGDMPVGMPVISVRCKDSRGEQREVTVRGGHIHVLPTPVPGEVVVDARAVGAATIAGKSHVHFTCAAGEVGVIIDARGRPLSLPDERRAAAAMNARWAAEMGAYDERGGA
jgi:hypothetical protein